MVDKKLVEKYSLSAIAAQSVILKTMYFGTGTDAQLEKINNYENEEQHILRKKLKISNEFITEELLRPVETIWEAKGGSTYYGISDNQLDTFKTKLKTVRPGMGLKQFIKEIWFENFVTDPNGLIFLEVQDNQPVLTYKDSAFIKAYQNTGTRIDWVMFNSHRETESKKPVYWYVDALVYQEIIETETGYEVLTEIKNTFKKVPAIINSSIFSTNTGRFISPIHKQIDLLKSFLVKNSVKEIYQFLHLYPVFWQYETLCPVCSGKRVGNDGKACPVCGGTGFTGKKDVSDVLVLKKPDDDNQAITPPAGYVQPSLKTMQEQRIELEWMFNEMFHSHWGTSVEKTTNETATGRFIDIQPVNNKLNWYASIAETIESKIIDLFGAYYYPLTYKSSIVTYGRRFMIESADSILTRYQTAKKNFAPTKVLDMLLEQFYYSEYQNDPQMIEYYLKLMKIEPYVHLSISDVSTLDISDINKQRKAAFPEWQKTVSIPVVVTAPINKLINLLTKFIENGSKVL